MTVQIVDVNTLFGFWPKRKADISLDMLLSLIEEKGISRACTLSARGIFYDFVAGNTETLNACRTHPELIPTGTLNPACWIGCREEARRLIDLGVRLFRFFPQYQEWHISQAPFRKLLDDLLVPSRVAIMLPAELGITAIGEVAKRIPNPIIVEAFRYDKLAEAIVVMQQTPNVFVETHLINSPNFLELLRAEVGLERVLYGSYAPLAYAGAALAPIQHARVPDEDRALILGGNIRRILEVSA
jgi:hypothetical protein